MNARADQRAKIGQSLIEKMGCPSEDEDVLIANVVASLREAAERRGYSWSDVLSAVDMIHHQEAAPCHSAAS